MEKNLQELLKAVATYGILGTLAAGIRALVVKGESPGQRLRTFFAGVLMAAFVGYLMYHSTIGEFYKILIVGSSSAFVSTAWPILEKIFAKWLTKKGDDVLTSTKPD